MIVTNYNKWKRINEEEELDNFDFDSIDLDNLDLGDFDYEEYHDDETASTLGLNNIEDRPIKFKDGSSMILKEYVEQHEEMKFKEDNASDKIGDITAYINNDLISKSHVDEIHKADKAMRDFLDKTKSSTVTSSDVIDIIDDTDAMIESEIEGDVNQVQQYIIDNATESRPGYTMMKEVIIKAKHTMSLVLHEAIPSLIWRYIYNATRSDKILDVKHLWSKSVDEINELITELWKDR